MKPPQEYQTVKQPAGSRLCGAAVAAMAVGETLDRVVADARGGSECCSRLTWMAEYLARKMVIIGAYAIANGWQRGNRLSISEATSLTLEIPIAGWPCILGVDSETSTTGALHWVFWDGFHVRDPNPSAPDKRPLSDYDNSIVDVYPLTYIDDEYSFAEWAAIQASVFKEAGA